MSAIDRAIVGIEGELSISMGSAELVALHCTELGDALGHAPAGETESTLDRLASLLAGRSGPVAAALFDFLAAQARVAPDPRALLFRLLGTADDALRTRAVSLVFQLARARTLEVDRRLVLRLAELDEATPLPSPMLVELGGLLRLAPLAALVDPDATGELLALLLDAPEAPLRRLAARLLDAGGERPGSALVAARVGRAAAATLLPYLEHSGATFEDVLALIRAPTAEPPVLAGLRRAEKTLGPALLRTVIGELGWPRIACGLAAEPRVAVSVGGSFPFIVSPAQAALLAEAGETQTLWRKSLVVAHGGTDDGREAAGSDETVQRFRRYNLAHAELLEEILAVAPLDEAKAQRILRLMDAVVADFVTLFAGTTADTAEAAHVYAELRQAVTEGLTRDARRGAPSGDTVRRLQMFEDPQRLAEVTTVHGLKRYLHQQGLRLAFRLFRSFRGANRTVDLLVASEREVLRQERCIRYLEFEPTAPVGLARLPFVVSLLAEALGRQLLLGRKPPNVTLLGYGNELQVFVNYLNHPAFVRIDLSPPLRGGMLDLEYFAVSQYELDQHPDLGLPAIQRVMRELDLDVAKDGLRLHARYDKERARDLGDLVAHVRALFELLPYLMEVDWVVGDLDYPQQARAEVAEHWAAFFARWGALPAAEVLSASRRKIVTAVEPDPAGPREVTWEGRGPYRDLVGEGPPGELLDRLREVLARRSLATLAGTPPGRRGAVGQRLLDQALLRPLAEAAARGEVRERGGRLEPAPPELFVRQHEAERLANVLRDGGPELARAAQLAPLVRSVERQARFRTTGSIQGHAVQAALLPTAPEPIGLFVLRDDEGMVELALAIPGGVACRSRGASLEPWRGPRELDPGELARALRSYNYVGPGPPPAPAPGEAELAALRERFATPSAAPVSSQSDDERVVAATVAAPGRATGFARFGSSVTAPEQLEGGVLVARTVRPEDAPSLRHATALVTTGGGILSHIGLLALELGKPALVVDGRWATARSGAEVLVYRRPRWRELATRVGPYRVVCRHELLETEEAIEQGDLLTVDGDGGALVVLGHDAEALALHGDLYQLETAAAALAGARADGEVLAARGRLIRSTHQLEKLLARLDHVEVARHAVREILSVSRAPLPAAGRQGRARLLSALLRNPACAAETRASAARRLDELEARHDAASRELAGDLGALASPSEIAFSRLGLERLREALAEVHGLMGACGIESRGSAATGETDSLCRHRLAELHGVLTERARACVSVPAERWRARHLLRRLHEIAFMAGTQAGAEALGGLASELARVDQERLREVGGRHVVSMYDGGLELRSVIGGKAAHLGEVVRILGPGPVPPFFTVGDFAFHEALVTAVPAQALQGVGLAATPASLAAAVEAVVGSRELDVRRQCEAVRTLWRTVPLSRELVAQVASAYAELSDESGDALVAVRSSASEEDEEAAAWAGQFDTFLFVRGLEALLEHLRLAWAGFWSERAIHERRVLGIDPIARGGGIIVQRMVDARASGVLHTVSAANGRLREMVINAGLGLGEGVVSGVVDVDHILVRKDEGIERGELELRYQVGDKREQIVWDRERGVGTRRKETLYHQRLRPALEYVELCELVRAASALEHALVEPLDIEFAIAGRGLHVLQARPVPVFDAAVRETAARYPLAAEAAVTEVRP